MDLQHISLKKVSCVGINKPPESGEFGATALRSSSNHRMVIDMVSHYDINCTAGPNLSLLAHISKHIISTCLYFLPMILHKLSINPSLLNLNVLKCHLGAPCRAGTSGSHWKKPLVVAGICEICVPWPRCWGLIQSVRCWFPASFSLNQSNDVRVCAKWGTPFQR